MYITIGILGAPYGIRGYIRLRSFTKPITNVFLHEKIVIHDKCSYKPVHIKLIKTTEKDTFIVSINNVSNREEVKTFTNKKLLVNRENLPKLGAGEFYWCDIIGMEVVSACNESHGIVVDIIETGSNDIFVISGNKKRLLPYTQDAVINIDAQERKITVNSGFCY